MPRTWLLIGLVATLLAEAGTTSSIAVDALGEQTLQPEEAEASAAQETAQVVVDSRGGTHAWIRGEANSKAVSPSPRITNDEGPTLSTTNAWVSQSQNDWVPKTGIKHVSEGTERVTTGTAVAGNSVGSGIDYAVGKAGGANSPFHKDAQQERSTGVSASRFAQGVNSANVYSLFGRAFVVTISVGLLAMGGILCARGHDHDSHESEEWGHGEMEAHWHDARMGQWAATKTNDSGKAGGKGNSKPKPKASIKTLTVPKPKPKGGLNIVGQDHHWDSTNDHGWQAPHGHGWHSPTADDPGWSDEGEEASYDYGWEPVLEEK